jgi:dihydroflavonol-4-reductase
MKVLVTGANGHLGYNLIKQLMTAGHQVRGSVRSLDDPSRVDHLRSIGVPQLVEADLGRPELLRAAMDGIDVVCHTAAVYALYAPGREHGILTASIDGASAVMRAARDAGVRKVVLTSSIVTLPMTRPGDPPSTEAQWASDLRVPYVRAKTLAEQRAWELARELGVHLVTILPGAFGGPGFIRNTPTIDVIETIMKGSLQLVAPPFNYPYVDVRDVAHAHILAVERDCSGRFVAANDTFPSLAEIASAMHAVDPRIPKPLLTMPGFALGLLAMLDGLNSRIVRSPRTLTPELVATMRGRIFNASNERTKRELGWRPEMSLRQSLADTIATLRMLASRREASGAVAGKIAA